MPKLIAIASADFHIHKFRNFNTGNSRLVKSVEVLHVLSDRCHKMGVPLLFAGDWYHTPEHVENETHSLAMRTYEECFERRGIEVYAISGNHDMNQRNAVDHQSPTHLHAYEVFKTFHLLDRKSAGTKNFVVYGVPYMNNDKDLSYWVKIHSKDRDKDKVNILMIHSDIPGAQTTEGIEVKETEYIPKDLRIFKHFDFVIAGHIHKPQELGKNVIMCGSPMHQNLGDEGIQMGYWELYKDGSRKFKPLDFPQFKRGAEQNDGNYWVEPEVVLVDEEVELGEFSINHSRKKLATLYCKRKGIKNKTKRRALIEVLNSTE